MIGELVDGITAGGACWLWMATPMRNGDLYHACAFAKAFRDRHGYELPIHIVVGSESAKSVTSLFGEHFASVHVCPAFAPTEEDWRRFFLERDLPNFGPNSPLVLHPQRNPQTSQLDSFVRSERIVWGQLYKFLLDLPAHVEPSAPRVDADRVRAASELLAANGMVQGRSMVLFPYAQSLPVEANAHFAALTAEAKRRGWTVRTSVAPGEPAVEGADPVFIPFDLLPDLAEQAGWVVAVRSGVCDIVSSRRCRKTFIFRQENELSHWGLKPLELAHDATEIAFPFVLGTPAAFAARVLDTTRSDVPELEAPTLSGSLVAMADTEGVRTVDFAEAQHARQEPPPSKRFVRKKRAGLARLINLPSRGHPRWAELAATQIGAFAEAQRDCLFYACRDRAGVFDFYEEVDPVSLTAGRYRAADYWHTIIATPAPDLAAALPERLRRKVLKRRPLELGHFARLGALWETPAHYEISNGDRPIDANGLQLLSGWSDLEPWGLWSEGDRSVLKFSVASPPKAPQTLELGCLLGVTQRGGVLHLRMSVNGALLLSRDVAETEETELRLTIPPEVMPNGTAFIELDHPHARSQRALGLASDPRRIAVGLTSAVLRHGA